MNVNGQTLPYGRAWLSTRANGLAERSIRMPGAWDGEDHGHSRG